MKIKIIKDIILPNTFYKKGTILDSSNLRLDSQKEYENLYRMFITSSYATEVIELQNNYEEDWLRYIICDTCRNTTSPIAKCERCKYYRNTNSRDNVYKEIVNLIKSK